MATMAEQESDLQTLMRSAWKGRDSDADQAGAKSLMRSAWEKRSEMQKKPAAEKTISAIETSAKSTDKKTDQVAKGKKTKTAQQEALEDLRQHIGQLEDTLADTKPDSPTHKRITASLAEAKRELASYGMQPAVAKAEPAPAAAPVVTPTAAPVTAPAAPAPQPKVAGISNKFLRSVSDVAATLDPFLSVGAFPGAAAAELGYAGVRGLEALGLAEPGRAERGKAAVYQKFSEPFAQPLGKALGVSETPEYKGATVQQLVRLAGETASDYAGRLANAMGVPKADVENMFFTGSLALPAIGRSLSAEGQRMIAGAIKPEAKPPTVKVEPTLEKPRVTFEEFRAQQAKKSTEEARAQFAQKQAMAGVGAAAAKQNPYLGRITGEENVRGAFPQVKLSKITQDVAPNEQALRSNIVQEILPNQQVRPGVITGNELLLRDEHTKSKLDTPEGLLYKQQIANEQNALTKYAEDRVAATGARSTFINDEQRGNFINDVAFGKEPEDMSSASLTGYLNQTKKQIYDSAFKNVGNNKIKTSAIDSFFSNAQQMASAKTAGTLNVFEGAKELIELAKTVGFELPDGKIAPAGSVAALDAVKKANNANWTPEKASTIRKINQAIDKDIAAVADPTLYKLGDKIHQIERTILGSNAFKRLFGEVDKNGIITSKIAPEKLLSSLNNLRKDEWRHIRNTFNDLANGRVRGAPEGLPPIPQELRDSAAAAVAEMDGALAREVLKAGSEKAGVWNQNSVNKVLNSIVGEKIAETFSPQEVQRFHILNYGGYLMPGVHSYEGAALQARRLGTIEAYLPYGVGAAGGSIGAFLGESPGAAIGGVAGTKLGLSGQAYLEQKALKKQAQKAQKQMQEAAKLGKQTGENKISDMAK